MSLPLHSPFDLSGRAAIVTGGARGLGQAIALALARHGARVTILDVELQAARTAAAGIARETGGDAQARRCDVRDDGQVKACVEEVADRCRRLDLLINNAGIHRRHSPADFPQPDIDALIGVNLLGVFYAARAAGRFMLERGGGSIVNLSALGGGMTGLGRGGSIYGATKGAIVALTRDLAAEWGRHGVRVNAIAPGWIRTPMTEALQQDPARSRRVTERIPLGRWGLAEEVAAVAVFLASDASAYISGHTIPVDGGASNTIAIPDESNTERDPNCGTST